MAEGRDLAFERMVKDDMEKERNRPPELKQLDADMLSAHGALGFVRSRMEKEGGDQKEALAAAKYLRRVLKEDMSKAREMGMNVSVSRFAHLQSSQH